MAPPRVPTIDRFMTAFVVAENGCWLWTRPLYGGGYGRLRDSDTGRQVRAHVFAYKHFVGPIPEGMEVDHLCFVRHCVAPLHLEAVPPRINTLRSSNPAALNAQKILCVRGHPLVGDNVYTPPKRPTARLCKTCQRDRVRAYRTRA